MNLPAPHWAVDPAADAGNLTGWQLHLAQGLWVALAVVVFPMLLFGIPARYSQMLSALVAEKVPRMLLGELLGQPPQFDATLIVIIDIFHTMLWVGSAAAIFLRQPRNRIALMASFVLLLVGAVFPGIFPAAADAGATFVPWLPRFTEQFFLIVGVNMGMLCAYLLPTGRFGARWIRWMALIALGWSLSWPIFPAWFVTLIGVSSLEMVSAVNQTVWITWVSTIVVAFIIRYRRIWSAVERQQTKWVAIGYIIALIGSGFRILPLAFIPSWWFGPLDSLSPHWVWLLDYWLGVPVSSLLIGFAPVAVAFAVLRYRLWDITPIGYQFIVYVLLTGVLATLSVAAIILIQNQIERSELPFNMSASSIVVVTTLLLTLLILPLRNQIQLLIDRRFYRSRLDQQQRLALLHTQLRTTIALPEIETLLTHQLVEDLQLSHATLYLSAENDPNQWHVAQTTLTEPPPPIPDTPIAAQLFDQGRLYVNAHLEPFALLIPLQSRRAGQTALEGVLMIGPWSTGQGFSTGDRRLLRTIKEPAGTALFITHQIAQKQAAERRLRAHRESPIGRAEAVAAALIEQPQQSLNHLYQIAQNAFVSPDQAAMLDNLAAALTAQPPSTTAPSAEQLALLVEGFNDIVRSKRHSQLLSVGLELVASQLTAPAFQAQPQAITLQQAYLFARGALAIESLPDAVALRPLLDPTSTLAASTAALLQTVEASQQVTTSADQTSYLVQLLEELDAVNDEVQSTQPALDAFVQTQLIAHWRRLTTRHISNLQIRPNIDCTLLTQRIWQTAPDETQTLAIQLRNVGQGVAHNVRVQLLNVPAAEPATLDHLRPREAETVSLTLPPDWQPARAAEANTPHTLSLALTFTDARNRKQETLFSAKLTMLARPQQFQFISNPYMVGPPLPSGSPLFYGRDELLTAIEALLVAKSRNNLVLIGQRRMGKTSLLKQLETRLRSDHLVAFLDGQSLVSDPGVPSFLLRLATEICFAAEDIDIFIEPPQLSDFNQTPYLTFEQSFLPTVRAAIGDRHIILLLDEFEELEASVTSQRLDRSIFNFLRSLIQHEPTLRIMFSGTHQLEALSADYWNILFNISLYRQIGHLQKADALHLIQDPVAAYGMLYDDLALDKLWRVTSGHPYFLQLLCHHLVDLHNRQQHGYVTIDHVNAAIEDVISVGQAHIIFMWNESSHTERAVLLALCQLTQSSTRIATQQVIDYLAAFDVSLTHNEATVALKSLVQRNILRQELLQDGSADGPNREHYRWHIWLFGLWIERHQSIKQLATSEPRCPLPAAQRKGSRLT